MESYVFHSLINIDNDNDITNDIYNIIVPSCIVPETH